jgi:hypothetical protein|tara:strand:+ start:523 stop:924 length:402 start_codon:yes stop_codon:yes gene_type:complete
MVFLTLKGFEKKVRSTHKYIIDWEGKSLSKLQKQAKEILYEYWCSDFVYEEFPVAGTRLSFDFYNASKKIALEVDGRQHYRFNKHFHSNSRQNFLDQLRRDDTKERFCEANNITLYRVVEGESIKDQIESLNL